MQEEVLFQRVMPRIRSGMQVVVLCMALAFAPPSAAESKMPLNPKAKSVDTSSEGIGVLVFRLENHRKERVVPRIGSIHVHDENGEMVVKYKLKKPWGFLSAKGDALSPLQVVSVQLPAGAYAIRILRGYGMPTKGMSRGTPMGTWGFELDYPLAIEKGKIVYLGRVNGAIVDKDDEQDDSTARSFATFQGLIPTAIDNKRAGFIGGVFKIERTSAYEEDMVLLKERYPWLDTTAIEDISEK